GAVTTTTVSSGHAMQAEFTPNFGLTLAQAAAAAGYDHFQWYQKVTNDPNPWQSTDNASHTVQPLKTPYTDLPLGGYYDYNIPPTLFRWADNLPYYWDEQSGAGKPGWNTAYLLSSHTVTSKVTFIDGPHDDSLQSGQFIGLTTSLVGVKAGNAGFDILYTFSWKTNWDGGTNGGILPANLNFDDSGSGGIYDVQLNLAADDLPISVREHMAADWAQNVPTPPLLTVANVQINDGSAQRSMIDSITITFSAAVAIQGDPNNAIQLFDLTTSQVVQGVTFTLSADKTAVTLTFTGSQFIGNSLADGRYILTIHGDKILGSQGQAVDGDGDGFSGGDYLTTFFRDFGDVFGDAVVDRFDKSVFMTTYKSTSSDSNYIWYLDFDADGVINSVDLVQLSLRLGLGHQVL